MPRYTVKHQKDAAKERDWLCCTYGQSFRDGYEKWMAEMADDATPQHKDGIFDLEQAFEDIQDQTLTNWHRSYKRFLQAGYQQKLQALMAVVKNRRPPWQLKGAARAIIGLDGLFTVNVNLVLETNDLDALLVVRQVLHHAL